MILTLRCTSITCSVPNNHTVTTQSRSFLDNFHIFQKKIARKGGRGDRARPSACGAPSEDPRAEAPGVRSEFPWENWRDDEKGKRFSEMRRRSMRLRRVPARVRSVQRGRARQGADGCADAGVQRARGVHVDRGARRERDDDLPDTVRRGLFAGDAPTCVPEGIHMSSRRSRGDVGLDPLLLRLIGRRLIQECWRRRSHQLMDFVCASLDAFILMR